VNKCPRELRARGQQVAVLAAVPFEPRLTAPRLSDVVETLDLDVAYQRDLAHGRVHEIVVSGRGVEGVIDRFRPGALIVVAGERSDTSTAPRHWPKPCRSRHQVREATE
jgi:phosphate acetyltransferase